MSVLGVIADTHIPDRTPQLNPLALEIFRQAEVKAILHAGDISVPRVLDELARVAPVHAVRGNRDIFYLRHLPLEMRFTVDGVSIGMSHGHGTFFGYMVDKLNMPKRDQLMGFYTSRLLQAFPDVEVIVFGHVHEVCNVRKEGKLLFNPGSASFPMPRGAPATVGLLTIDGPGAVRGEIIRLR
jgi:putative phosphoesterase